MTGEGTGPAWRDFVSWSALCDGSACPICTRGEPLDVLVEFPASWVTGPRVAPLPGYVAVVSKRHVVEPFQLPAGERPAFWEDAMTAAGALSGLFRPVKMNYEIHGNTIPHLHMHLYPRSRGDPFEGRPIDPRIALFTRGPEDLARIRRALVATRERREPQRGNPAYEKDSPVRRSNSET